MCFDEVSSTSDSVSKMSFVYADALTHKIQNILQGRTNKIIKDYFLYNGLSNGPLEGINNKTKVIKRISYGYRSFSNFKAKILLVFILFIPSETDKKSRYSKEERQAILTKKKKIILKRRNRKKAVLLNIA